MKKIPSERLLKPSLALALIFGGQYIVWLLFFPSMPTVDNGEPKEFSIMASMVYFIGLSAAILCCVVGEKVSRSNVRKNNDFSLSLYYRVSLFFLYVFLVVSLLKFEIIINDPAILFSFLEPAGSNKIHVLLSESSFGVASLQTLWIIPAIVLGYMLFDGQYKGVRFFRMHFILLIIGVLFAAAVNSARVILLNFLMILAFLFVYIRKPKLSIGKIVLSFLVLMFVYWLGSIYRDGLVYSESRGISVLDPETTGYIFSVFIEKYSIGDLNNSLVFMSYEPEGGNYAYGTAFQRFLPATAPDRYLNTANVFALWNWQFGLFGMVVVASIFGFTLGSVYKKSMYPKNQKILRVSTVVYLMLYVGIFNATRVNFYFLQTFFVPIVFFFSAMFLLKVVRGVRWRA